MTNSASGATGARPSCTTVDSGGSSSYCRFFPCPVFNSNQRFVQILQRIRHIERRSAPCLFPKRGPAGETRNPGLFQQRVGQLFGGPSRFRNIGEGIERAFRHPARKPFDLVQASHKNIAAVLEFSAHFFNRRLVAAQRFNPSNLREAGRAASSSWSPGARSAQPDPAALRRNPAAILSWRRSWRNHPAEWSAL